MSSVGYHEPVSEMSDETRDMHRAIVSLMEEEKEHAAMVLEWIRRQDSTFSKEMKDYLFTDKPIAHK